MVTVYPNGSVCISILHPPGDDPLRYESASERWSPVQGVRSVLLSVLSMLAEPNIESGADIEVSLRKDFDEEARSTSAGCSVVNYIAMTEQSLKDE